MNTTNCNKQNLIADKTLKDTCFDVCEKIVKQVGQVKNDILAEFQGAFQTHEQLLRLAVVEADALAWQTDYPHLLFPVLATEKIQSAANWRTRQQRLLRGTANYTLAA